MGVLQDFRPDLIRPLRDYHLVDAQGRQVLPDQIGRCRSRRRRAIAGGHGHHLRSLPQRWRAPISTAVSSMTASRTPASNSITRSKKSGRSHFPVMAKGDFHVASNDQNKISLLRSSALLQRVSRCSRTARRRRSGRSAASRKRHQSGRRQGHLFPPGEPQFGMADRRIQQHQQPVRTSGALPGLPHVEVPVWRRLDLRRWRHEGHQPDARRLSAGLRGGARGFDRRRLSAHEAPGGEPLFHRCRRAVWPEWT